jgi:hypothetical protein
LPIQFRVGLYAAHADADVQPKNSPEAIHAASVVAEGSIALTKGTSTRCSLNNHNLKLISAQHFADNEVIRTVIPNGGCPARQLSNFANDNLVSIEQS